MFDQRSRASASDVYLVMRAVAGFASNLVYAVLALMYIQVAGMDPLQLVLVGTALEATYFLLEIPTGALADSYSRRFSVIAGFAIIALTWIGQAIAPVFVAIIMFEAMRGVGEAFLSGAQDAWIAGEVGDDSIAPLFLRGQQLESAASILALPASVALGIVDVRIPVFISGVLLALLASYLVLVMPERGFTRARSTEHSWTRLAVTARDGSRLVRGRPILMSIVAIAFFAGLASEGTDRLSEAHFVSDLGLPAGLPAVVWFGLISIGARLISIVAVQVMRSWLLRVVADDRTMANVLAAYTAGHLGCQLAFAWAPGFATGLAAQWGQRLLTTGGAMDAWTIRQINPSVRATVLSMQGTLSGIGQVAGGPPVGALGSLFGIRAALTASALLLLPVVVLYRRAAAFVKPPLGEVRAQDTAR